MELPEHYDADVLLFFDGHPREFALYDAFFQWISPAFPLASVKVQKSQISFYGTHLFAAVSLPVRRKKDWPEHCILVTFGLSHQVLHPRIAVSVEPYPNRWTHHVPLSSPQQLDGQLMDWLQEAFLFAQEKSRCKPR